ncbi:MAG: pilus assembly protein PilM [bacterium]|nr:pilus assembly protein PilM [bacterium]
MPVTLNKGSFASKLLVSTDRQLAVDIGSRWIKLAELHRRKERIEVRLLDAAPIAFASARGDVTPTQITETLEKLLRRHNLKHASVISILPREFVTVKRFEVPSTRREQIEQMVPFEAEKYVPFALERAQLSFDFEALGAETADNATQPAADAAAGQVAVATMQIGEQRALVHLAAARRSVIAQFLKLYDVRGVKQHAIDVSTFATYNAFAYHVRRQPRNAQDGDILLVELGARRTEFILIAAATGALVFSRSVEHGGDLLTEYIANHDHVTFEEAEKRKCEQWRETCLGQKPETMAEALQPLLAEFEKTLRYVNTATLTARVGTIVLSGGGAMTPGLPTLVQERLHMAVELFDPLGDFAMHTDTAPAPAFSGVIGAALRMVKESRITVDLLPVDVAKLQTQAVRKKRLIQAGIAAGILLLGGLMIFGARVAWSAITLKQLTAEQATLRPLLQSVSLLEREYTLLSNSVNQMEQIIETKTSWSQALRTLSECMNSNVWVRQLQVNTRQRRNTLTITARAVTLEDYIRFKDVLGKSTRFEKIEVPTTTRQPDDTYEFEITCEVLPDYKYIERLMEKKARIMDVMKKPAVRVQRVDAVPVSAARAPDLPAAAPDLAQTTAPPSRAGAEPPPQALRLQEEPLRLPEQPAGVPRVPPIGLALTNMTRLRPALSQPPVTTP